MKFLEQPSNRPSKFAEREAVLSKLLDALDRGLAETAARLVKEFQAAAEETEAKKREFVRRVAAKRDLEAKRVTECFNVQAIEVSREFTERPSLSAAHKLFDLWQAARLEMRECAGDELDPMQLAVAFQLILMETEPASVLNFTAKSSHLSEAAAELSKSRRAEWQRLLSVVQSQVLTIARQRRSHSEADLAICRARFKRISDAGSSRLRSVVASDYSHPASLLN